VRPSSDRDATLRGVATTPGQNLTYTCVPPGEGERSGVDRDNDGVYDGDEADAGTDPANDLSFPGTAVDVLGKRILVKDQRPNEDESRRRLILLAKRAGAPALVGNPVTDGAILNVSLSGVLPTEQTYNLPSSGWASLGSNGFRYTDQSGANGPVKTVLLKRTSAGRMTFKVVALGSNGLIEAPAAEHRHQRHRHPGHRHHPLLHHARRRGGGTISANTETLFKVKNPTASVVLPVILSAAPAGDLLGPEPLLSRSARAGVAPRCSRSSL
jgi:hypothetical protein